MKTVRVYLKSTGELLFTETFYNAPDLYQMIEDCILSAGYALSEVEYTVK